MLVLKSAANLQHFLPKFPYRDHKNRAKSDFLKSICKKRQLVDRIGHLEVSLIFYPAKSFCQGDL